jgi:hypothetical protein
MADIFDRLTQQRRDEEDDIFTRMARAGAPSRGVISETARGLATGLATTGTSLVGGVGTLTGSEALKEWARQTEEEARQYYGARGTAGTVGEFIGRGAGEIATGAGLAKGVALGAARYAPRVAAALTSADRLKRIGATAAVNAPVDILQGASQGEGVALPGTAGAIAENVAFSALGGALPVRQRPPAPETRPERLLPAKARGIEPGQLEGVAGPAIPMPAESIRLRQLPEEATPEDVAAYIAQRGSREALRQRGRIPSLSGRTARRPEAQRMREAAEERAAMEAGEVIGKAFEGRLPQSLRRFSDEDLRATFNAWDRKVQETAMTANAMDETAQINFGEQMTNPMGYKRAKQMFGTAEDARQYKDFSEEQAGIMEELNMTARDIRAMRAAGRRLPALERQRDRILAEMERRGLSMVDESTDFPFGANVGEAVEEAAPVAGETQKQLRRLGGRIANLQAILDRQAFPVAGTPEAADAVMTIPKRLSPEEIAGIKDDIKRTREQMRSLRPGFIQGELLAQGGGALLGGVAGAATAEEGDRADLLGRAALGAAAGAGLGRIATQPDRFFRSLTDARSTYEKRLAEGVAGVRKKLAEGQDQFNKSLQQLDPTGRELWREEQRVLEQAGEVRRAVSDREIKDFARTINVDEIVARDLRKLDTVQIAALGNRIVEDRAQLNGLLQRLDDGGLSAEDVTRLSEQRDALLNRLVGYDRVYNAAASEQGRGMRMLGRMMVDTGKVDFSQALRLAKRALDVPRGAALSETATNAIKGIFTDTSMVSDKQRAEALAKVLDDLRGGTPLDVLLDNRRAGLLSAFFSWATNITGSVAGAAETAIANPIAAALDNAYVEANRKLLGREIKRTVTFGGRAATYAKRFTETLPTVLDSRWYKGIDPGNPLADLAQKRINYANALGLGEKEGETAFRATLRGGAKLLQAANDAIYGVMTATDAPFYEAALAASLKERATLRAMNEFGKEAWGSGQFLTRVKELMNPMTSHPVDASMAIAEALDATFKTPTRIARMAREAGPVGAYVAPFANTPTNLIRRGLESIPGIGLLPAKTQMNNITKRLQALGVSKQEVADEVRRYRTKILGRQLTTGFGGIAAGYALAKAGLLTQEYVDPRTATPEQREEMQRRQLTGQAPLTLRIGDTAYSLAPFATIIPALAIGAAFADAAKDEDATFVRTVGRGGQSALRTIGQLPVLQGAETMSELLSGRARPSTFGREAATFLPFSSAIAAAGRGMDEIGKRRPETAAEGFMERIPILRERVAPEVGVFGETTPSAGFLNTMVNPLRPQRVRTGGLYDVLQELDVSPTRPAKREGETQAAYAARRGGEGANEMALLEDLLAGNPQAWKFVPAGAKRAFRADVESGNVQEAWRGALRAALSSQRKEVTGYAKSQAERQARREGLLPNSTAFTERVAQLMAGQP